MQIRIQQDQNLLFNATLDGPVEFGRQRAGEPLPYGRIPVEGGTRLVIASLREQAVSRQQLRIEPQSGGRVLVENLSSSMGVELEDGTEIPPRGSATVALPTSLQVGRRMIRVEADPVPDGVQSLASATLAPSPSRSQSLLSFTASEFLSSHDNLQWDRVIEWLRSVMNVLQGAATTDDFFETAAAAAVAMVDLASARVLTWEGGWWKTLAVSGAETDEDIDWNASRHVLQRVRDEKRTFWKSGTDLGEQAQSLMGFSSVVAAPILDERGDTIAVLYGDRRRDLPQFVAKPLSELDAVLVELLASGVASGLARLEQERAALAAQTRFEEFFTPRLSRRLMNDPTLLEGQSRRVTVFFCDIRGFSRITERLGPAATVGWLNKVMGVISDAVLDEEGVLVDYSGDEAMAMWGAPEEQPDQAVRACRAGLSILAQLPELNRKWSRTLGEEFGVGIGINTGDAYVGNIGSHRKFKYGPLGNVVNQSSRLQGATKYFGCSMLVSQSTLDGLEGGSLEFSARRICCVKVVNIEEPIPAYELIGGKSNRFEQCRAIYERALEAYESGELERARVSAASLLSAFPNDGPARSLLKRIEEQSGGTTTGPVWTLPGK